MAKIYLCMKQTCPISYDKNKDFLETRILLLKTWTSLKIEPKEPFMKTRVKEPAIRPWLRIQAILVAFSSGDFSGHFAFKQI